MINRKLLIAVLLVGVLAMVAGQADLNNSYTVDKMPLEDRALFWADFLVHHPALFNRLIRIGGASKNLFATGGGGPTSHMFFDYVLDMLPFILQSDDTKDILNIINNELSLVNTTSAMMDIRDNQLNSTMAKKIMAGAITKGFNKVRTVQRILTRHSVRKFLPMSQNDTITDVCYNDLMNFIDILPGIQIPPRADLNYTFVKWAISMFDAFGKPHGGISKGLIYWVGSYDLCRDIHAKLSPGVIVGNRTLTAPLDFKGKFCRAQFSLPKSLIDSFGVDTRGVSLSLSWGMCVPDSCHSDDIANFFDLGMLKGKGLDVKRITCFEDKDITKDTSALAASLILAIFVIITLFTTVVDGVGDWWKDNVESSSNEDEETVYELGTPSHVNEAFVPDSVSDGSPRIVMETNLSDLPQCYMPHKHDKGELEPAYINASVTHSTPNGSTAMNVPVIPIADDKKTPKKRNMPICQQLTKAFSLYTNIPKLMSAKKNPNAIDSLHGIRVFSILWIILAHSYNYGLLSEDDNTTMSNIVDVDEITHRFTFNGVMGAGLAVDSFFMISGFLICYLTLKDIKKRKRPVNCGYFGMYYFHRFWRLTPVYMMVMMTYSCLHTHIGGGPLWPASIKAAESCKQNWWTNLLYINNFVKTDDQCMGWSWYLAVDMQFYLISPIFIMLLHYKPAVGVVVTILMMFSGISSSFAKEYVFGGDMFSLRENPHYWPDVYIVPWTRVGAYCVGLLLGYIMLNYKKGTLKNKHALIGWVLTFAVGITLIYLPYDYRGDGHDKWQRWGMALYESFCRPLWAMCVAWVVFACHNGKGGLIDNILSFRGIIPLSRLTYTCYLIHPILMQMYVFSRRSLVYISDYDMAYLYMAYVLAAYIGAFTFSLVFEAPFLTLEKIIFGR